MTRCPASIACRSPARIRSPAPVAPAPSTRTLCSLQAGAIERTIPAHAVPWPQTSPVSSSTTAMSSPLAHHARRRSRAGRRADGPPRCRESTMQTSTSPLEPPIAQSRVTASRHPPGAATSGTRSPGEAPGRERPRAHVVCKGDVAARSPRPAAAASARVHRARRPGVVARFTWTSRAAAALAASARVAAAHASPRTCSAPSRAASAARYGDVGRRLRDLQRHLGGPPERACRAPHRDRVCAAARRRGRTRR